MPNDDAADDNDNDDIPAGATGADGYDVRAVRAEILSALYGVARQLLTDESGYRSLYLACSQYYADEAGDAVHDSYAVSTSLWPTAEDAQQWYERIGYGKGLPWDSNEDGVYAFAPLCNEEGYADPDDDADEEAYEEGKPSALAHVQKLDGGELRISWLGTLHRPWLDFPAAMSDREEGYGDPPDFADDRPAPPLVGREQSLYDEVLAAPWDYGIRDVLRDQWMLRNDPRGELTAITTATKRTEEMRARAAALVLEQGRGWLGPLAAVIPFSGALFGPGPFVRKAIVYAAEKGALVEVANAPEWATVEELTFANQSARLVSPAMKNLRSVGPLGLAEIGALAEGTWRITTLEIDAEDPDIYEALVRLALPLETLRIHVDVDALDDHLAFDMLATAPWWPTLQRIELWLPSGSNRTADFSEAFATYAPQLREGCLLGVGRLSGGVRSGWMVVGTHHRQRLELVRFDARLSQGPLLAEQFDLALPTTPLDDPDDWLCFGIGVADQPAREGA